MRYMHIHDEVVPMKNFLLVLSCLTLQYDALDRTKLACLPLTILKISTTIILMSTSSELYQSIFSAEAGLSVCWSLSVPPTALDGLVKGGMSVITVAREATYGLGW
jgi:hypothetical protein